MKTYKCNRCGKEYKGALPMFCDVTPNTAIICGGELIEIVKSNTKEK